MKKGVKLIKCSHCGHEQKTKSKLKFITCSACQFKIKVSEASINNNNFQEIEKEFDKFDKQFKKEERNLIKKVSLD